jgi:iron(III) transport system substrate-binding protein
METAAMRRSTISRREILHGAAAAAAGSLLTSAKVLAAAPSATAITPQLIEAAKKEGKVIYYTSIDLPKSATLPAW